MDTRIYVVNFREKKSAHFRYHTDSVNKFMRKKCYLYITEATSRTTSKKFKSLSGKK